ncbi:MAG: hypothetical protein QF819_05655 [Gemmatimonadota bacterium]|jgi:hypothetical protein|nr:hypothetical protein [Gemmatimonadota bacterium]MDP6529054.1 hypothetical protein [Gemmatimonadota bacterium]MDP6802648.1 hypothetical protein [Gemmatimonadota bacterium]MDP7031647.1 hypothetical protein [Gemmatimonadota bacterium]
MPVFRMLIDPLKTEACDESGSPGPHAEVMAGETASQRGIGRGSGVLDRTGREKGEQAVWPGVAEETP